MLIVALTAQGTMAQRASEVRIVEFKPESGALAPGAVAESNLVIENVGPARTFWIGYSVQDPAGRWYDVPAQFVALASGERSTQRMAWTIPSSPPPTGGDYRVVMAVWSASPGTDGAQRLASIERAASFRVDVMNVPFGPAGAWQRGDHRLGRGRVDPWLATAVGSGFRLTLSPNGLDGSEVRSLGRVHFARATARMRTPNAPGSLSALFFYADTPGDNDEIDIEIYNDGTRRVLLSVWIAGKSAHSAELKLPFDPAGGMHDYAIDWSERALAFYADDRQLARWTDRFPKEPMRVMSNLWWATWLTGNVVGAPSDLLIEKLDVRRSTP